MDSKGVSLEVSKDIVKEIVTAQISTSVLEALRGKEGLIQEFVRQVLNIRTDEHGEVSRYSSDNRHSIVDVLCANAIREKASELVRKWVTENTPLIETAISESLKKNTKGIAASFVKEITEAAKGHIAIKVGLLSADEDRHQRETQRRLDKLEERLKG